MNCKKIQELILTDYLDDQISDDWRPRIKIHFARCNQCKEFFEAARKAVAEPFVNVNKINPPEFIWQRVKETIMAEQQKKTSLVASFLEKLKSISYAPKPAFAIAMTMAMVILVVTMVKLRINNQETLSVNSEGQRGYLAYSIEEPVDILANDNGGFGTSIEEYFL